MGVQDRTDKTPHRKLNIKYKINNEKLNKIGNRSHFLSACGGLYFGSSGLIKKRLNGAIHRTLLNYIVYLKEGGESVQVKLKPGSYRWKAFDGQSWTKEEEIDWTGGQRTFRKAGKEDWGLYIEAI